MKELHFQRADRMTFNPPIVWVLTAAEIVLGSFVVSWGYPITGGLVMGAAAGSFLTRATMPRYIDWVMRNRTGK